MVHGPSPREGNGSHQGVQQPPRTNPVMVSTHASSPNSTRFTASSSAIGFCTLHSVGCEAVPRGSSSKLAACIGRPLYERPVIDPGRSMRCGSMGNHSARGCLTTGQGIEGELDSGIAAGGSAAAGHNGGGQLAHHPVVGGERHLHDAGVGRCSSPRLDDVRLPQVGRTRHRAGAAASCCRRLRREQVYRAEEALAGEGIGGQPAGASGRPR